MNSRLLRTFVLAVISIFCGTANLTAYEPIVIGKGIDPKWSPIKERIAYLKGDSLFVVTGETGVAPVCIGVGPILRYEWLTDSCILIQQRHEQREREGVQLTDRILTVCLDGSRIEVAADSGFVGKDNRRKLSVRMMSAGVVGYVEEIDGRKNFHPISGLSDSLNNRSTPGYWVATDGRTTVWGKVWLYYGNSSVKRQLTLGETTYLLPKLAPTNDRFCCSNSRGDLLVFDTLGNELANLGRVDWPAWSSNGEWIAFCETEYSEFDILGSDVGIARFDGSIRRKLTETSDTIEVEPVFSPLSDKLIYREYRTGRLIITASGIQ